MSKRTAYPGWAGMMGRCYDPDNRKYPSYGGRGIKVCDRWICFRLFYLDMGDRPPNMTLNRIDNNGPYSPENCEWATFSAQAQNRRDNNLLSFGGEVLCVTEWARRIGIKRDTLRRRIALGWTVEHAITAPLGAKRCDP